MNRRIDGSIAALALAIPIQLAACGGGGSTAGVPPQDGGGAADASVTEDAAGSADASAPTAPVTILVTSEGKPQKAVDVMFHDAAGKVVAEAKTDSSGRASRAPAPSFVTVVTPRYGRIVTFAGVVPGDTLAVTGDDPLTEPPVGPVTARYKVTLPGAVSGSSSYGVSVGRCYGSTTNPTSDVVVDAYAGCSDTASAVLAGTQTSDGSVFFAWKTGLAPKGESLVAAALGAWTPATTTTLTIKSENLPPGATATRLVYAVLPDGERFLVSTFDSSAVHQPTGFASSYSTFFSFEDQTRSIHSLQRNAAAGPFVVDPADLLPCAADPKIAAVSADRWEASWTYAGPAPKSATVLILLLAGAQGPTASWTIVAPPGESKLRLPQLPGYLGVPSRVVQVDMLDSDAMTFDAARVVPTTTSGLGAFRARLPSTVGIQSRSTICYVPSS